MESIWTTCPWLAFNNDWSHPWKEQINYKCRLEIVKHYYALAGFGPKSSSIGLILKVIDSSEKVWLNLNLDKERTLEDHKNWKNQPCTQNIRHYKLNHSQIDSPTNCRRFSTEMQLIWSSFESDFRYRIAAWSGITVGTCSDPQTSRTNNLNPVNYCPETCREVFWHRKILTQ